MKKFLLTLSILAATFSATACDEEDGNNSGGSGNNSTVNTGDLSAAIDKYCTKEEECGGRAMLECQASNPIDSFSGNCPALVTELYLCIGNKSCDALADESENSMPCQEEMVAAFKANCVTMDDVSDGDESSEGI